MLASLDLSDVEAGRQGLKPHFFEALTARLKPRPFKAALFQSRALQSYGTHTDAPLQRWRFKTEWRNGFAWIDRAGAGRDNENAW